MGAPKRDFSHLTRKIQKMPVDVRRALTDAGLTARYRQRPAYQQNDYLAWIGRAVRPETRAKRLAEMLDDLRRGDRYMGMAYGAGKTKKADVSK
jgi:uncharacterized protein YdeI (YjbR/CyaY-like superfamily)